MAILVALQRTSDALQRNPVLLVPILALLLFQVPQLVSQSASPGLANFFALVLSVAFVLILPFVQGGLVAMAADALGNGTSLATFVEGGKRNYVSLLVVSLIFVVINIVVSIVVVFAGLVTLFARYPGGAGDTSALVVVVLTVVVVVVLAYLLLLYFIQFYAQAVVLDSQGAIDSLKRSASLVRANLASVFGYSVCVGFLGGLTGGLFGIFSLAIRPETSMSFGLPRVSLAGVLGISLVIVAVETLFAGFMGVFSVAFYRTLRD
ncbi:hypothetical protein HUG10_02885 [Halorarum halophilum]|uniref:DUF7847 domain-containing protein n=1 Tax=Halorarum halophilum TaxID=2743090 RepID=A0A7D5GW05_9EURY|nr:hypothetical protein [Halobaculum halophilum]QLG26549.1 hypothetical protein HUG10_02885 [Halobaculum halophilum]